MRAFGMNTRKNLIDEILEKELENSNIFDNLSSDKKSFPDSIASLSFYSKDIFASKRIDEQNFTNFLNSTNKTECEDVLALLLDDLKNRLLFKNLSCELDENISSTSKKNQEKLKALFREYVGNTEINLDFVGKAKVLTQSNPEARQGNKRGFRIYLLHEASSNTWRIILLDPLHLAWPSIENHTQKEKTFKKNKGNNLCMVRNIIQNNNTLKSIYNNLNLANCSLHQTAYMPFETHTTYKSRKTWNSCVGCLRYAYGLSKLLLLQPPQKVV